MKERKAEWGSLNRLITQENKIEGGFSEKKDQMKRVLVLAKIRIPGKTGCWGTIIQNEFPEVKEMSQ